MTNRQPALARMADMPGEKNSKTIAPATALPASTSLLIAFGFTATSCGVHARRRGAPGMSLLIVWVSAAALVSPVWVFPGWRPARARHHNRHPTVAARSGGGA